MQYLQKRQSFYDGIWLQSFSPLNPKSALQHPTMSLHTLLRIYKEQVNFCSFREFANTPMVLHIAKSLFCEKVFPFHEFCLPAKALTWSHLEKEWNLISALPASIPMATLPY